MLDFIFYLVIIYFFIEALLPNKKHYNNRRENYNKYIHSSAWRRKRERVLKRDHYKCRKCGKRNCRLEVHHLTYKNFGDEPLNDLITVCSRCHHKIHSKSV